MFSPVCGCSYACFCGCSYACFCGCFLVFFYNFFTFYKYFRIKGVGSNAMSNMEKQLLEKDAEDVMHALFVFMEDKYLSFYLCKCNH